MADSRATSSDGSFEAALTRYFLVGTLGAILWDVLANLSTDYTLFCKRRISLPAVAHILSRLSTLTVAFGMAIYTTTPLAPFCAFYNDAYLWVYVIAVSSTTLQFLVRIRALFWGNYAVIGFFTLLWLGVIGTSVSSILTISGTNLGDTSYCTMTIKGSYLPIGGIVPLVNDTLIFFAVTFRLVQLYEVEEAHRGLKNRVGNVVLGWYLPRLARSMMRDGQFYFFTIIASHIALVVTFYSPEPAYRGIWIIPNIALSNILACAISRSLRQEGKKTSELIDGAISTSKSMNVTFVAARPNTSMTFSESGSGMDMGISEKGSERTTGSKRDQDRVSDAELGQLPAVAFRHGGYR